MLGRMILYEKKEEIRRAMQLAALDVSQVSNSDLSSKYAEPLFKLLGARQVASLDFSDYEGATILHDLNKPVSPSLYNKYSMIFDGGTIEHVFNFPVCIENCMKMLRTGGHFISVTPCNNLMGHGFYQFSPELFFRVFSEENGFRVKKMFIAAVNPKDEIENWYEVNDPKEIGERVVLANCSATYLLVLAEKISDRSGLASTPQQSDYATTWQSRSAGQPATARGLKKYIPLGIRTAVRKILDLFFKKKIDAGDLGTVDPRHFKKFNQPL
jgi:hypothetical protein